MRYVAKQGMRSLSDEELNKVKVSAGRWAVGNAVFTAWTLLTASKCCPIPRAHWSYDSWWFNSRWWYCNDVTVKSIRVFRCSRSRKRKKRCSSMNKPQIGEKFIIADKLHYLITDIINVEGIDYYCVINEDNQYDIDICSLEIKADQSFKIVPLEDENTANQVIALYMERNKDKIMGME